MPRRKSENSPEQLTVTHVYIEHNSGLKMTTKDSVLNKPYLWHKMSFFFFV